MVTQKEICKFAFDQYQAMCELYETNRTLDRAELWRILRAWECEALVKKTFDLPECHSLDGLVLKVFNDYAYGKVSFAQCYRYLKNGVVKWKKRLPQ